MKVYEAIQALPPIPSCLNSIVGLLSTAPFVFNHNKLAFIDGVSGQGITFGQHKSLISRIAAVLHEKFGISKGDVVMLIARNNILVPAIHHATMWLGAVIAPVHVQYNSAEISHHIQMTQPKLILADDASTAIEACKLAEHNIEVVQYHNLVPRLLNLIDNEYAKGIDPVPVGLDATGLMCFSSGTSGLPKAVELTHYNLLQHAFQISGSGAPYTGNDDLVVGAFLPLSHIYGLHMFQWGSVVQGKTVVLFNRFDLGEILQECSNYGVGIIYTVPSILLVLGKDPLVDLYPKFKEQLKYVISSAGSLSRSSGDILTKRIPDVKIIQVYGLSETIFTFTGAVRDEYDIDTVGWPIPGTQARIISPETGDDVPLGASGEIWLRGPQIMKGYLNNPKATTETKNSEGWLKTGDVAVADETGQFKIVGRIKELIKSKGHQVAPAELEGILVTHPNVIDAAVIGVPDSTKTTELPRAFLVLRDKSNIIPIIQWFNKRVSSQKRLSGGGVIAEKIPVGATGKILRNVLRELHVKPEDVQGSNIVDLRNLNLDYLKNQARGSTVLQSVIDTAITLLGNPENARPDSTFNELGGDSLIALQFVNILREIFNIPVPVALVTSPITDLQSIADHIELHIGGSNKGPTYEDIHVTGDKKVLASELTLDRFMSSATLANAASLPPANPEPPRTILLTGATGFLGCQLALELLEEMVKKDGKVICLVRAKSVAEARTRLYRTFDKGNHDLLQYFKRLADNHLEVLAGDKSEDNLGLDEPTWQRLSHDVDQIVDSAALVNHVLPYYELFGPNVVGTAELIRLAISSRIKRFTYVSTIVVGQGVSPNDFVENRDVREMSSLRKIDSSYANGYATSKWAGEVLLREAHDLCGLPVSVFRCGMILAGKKYLGQINEHDMFTRMLLSLIVTGIAPYSFYELDSGGKRQRAHYDGLPVDFVAKSITKLGPSSEGFTTYHVMNCHDDGIGMDEYVDWLISVGHCIKRITKYSEWLQQFETSLRSLPAKLQAASLMPLLHNYQKPEKPICGSTFNTDIFREAVKKAGIGPTQDIPTIDKSLIAKYIVDLQHLNLI